MSIAENIRNFSSGLPPHVSVIAISKTKPREDILEAYQAGHRIFGENKVQELMEKQPGLPGDIQWHFVGHLQSNKVKYLAPFISMIHSVDSLKLLQIINKEAMKNDRIISCLLQVHIAEEETKFGLDEDSIREILDSDTYQQCRHVRIAGVMGMATFTDDEVQIRKEFRKLAGLFKTLKNEYFQASDDFREISMGMSGDYRIAIEEGSTMIRVGTLIFGPRFKNINF
jgi:pyridoxal phosphate enzyme (YggS family)